MRAIGQGHRCRGAGDLFDGDGVREVSHSRTAMVFVHGDAQKPKSGARQSIWEQDFSKVSTSNLYHVKVP